MGRPKKKTELDNLEVSAVVEAVDDGKAAETRNDGEEAVSKEIQESIKTEEPVKEEEPVETEEEKKSEKKAPVKRGTRKKTEKPDVEIKTTKKVAEKKEELNADVFVEYAAEQYSEKEMIEDIKRVWVEEGHRVSSIKSLELYVNVEHKKVYYVINKETKMETGDVDLHPVQKEQ